MTSPVNDVMPSGGKYLSQFPHAVESRLLNFNRKIWNQSAHVLYESEVPDKCVEWHHNLGSVWNRYFIEENVWFVDEKAPSTTGSQPGNFTLVAVSSQAGPTNHRGSALQANLHPGTYVSIVHNLLIDPYICTQCVFHENKSHFSAGMHVIMTNIEHKSRIVTDVSIPVSIRLTSPFIYD